MATSARAVFVDAWAWIGLAAERDQFHAQVTAEHRRLQRSRRPYITSDFVVSELITYLYGQTSASQAEGFIEGLFQAFDAKTRTLVHLTDGQFRRAWQMRQRYRDKPDISFVDFTSMVVMQDLGIADVFTGDRHFEQVGLGFRLLP
jgi:predicted nucleic acid-binding protein